MKITITGKTFTIKGTFAHFRNRRELGQQLVAQGGSLSESITTQTDVFILGDSWAYSAEGVSGRYGIPVLNEEQARTLLDQGELALTNTSSPTPRDEVLGEIRWRLDGDVETQDWNAITEHIDAISEDELPVLADFIDGRLHMREGATQSTPWLFGTPVRWLQDLVAGGQSEKYKVPRSLTLPYKRITSTNAVKLLKSGALENLRGLDVRIKNPSLSLYKAIAQVEGLTHLRIDDFKSKHCKALAGDHCLGTLRSLTLPNFSGNFEEEALRALLSSDWCRHVTTLVLQGNVKHILSLLAADESLLPNVQHYVFDTPNHGFAPVHVERFSMLRPAESVTLNTFVTCETGVLPVLGDIDASHIQCLDLSQLRLRATGHVDRDTPQEELTKWQELLMQELPSSNLINTLKSIRLGPWQTDSLIDAIENAGSDVLELAS